MQHPPSPEPWDRRECGRLIDRLERLQACMQSAALAAQGAIAAVHPSYADSAVNLLHYVEARRLDLRGLQERLARLGLSSLGRAETHVLANVHKVLGLLHLMAGRTWAARDATEPAGMGRAQRLLQRHTAALLGPAPAGRGVRVMVTMPREAAHDAAMVDVLVQAGMDVARINCAHDDAQVWTAMAAQIRRAGTAHGRRVRVLMELGGPKLRTTGLGPGPQVLHLRPEKGLDGRVLAPARLTLAPRPRAGALGVDPAWFERARQGATVTCVDARGHKREARVARKNRHSLVLETEQGVYLTPETRLTLRTAEGGVSTAVTGLTPLPARLRLRPGDRFELVESSGEPVVAGRWPRIACDCADALAQVQPEDPVYFDDGRLAAEVLSRTRRGLLLRVSPQQPGPFNLGEDKGINFPESALVLPALSPQDRADLRVAVTLADIVGLSFTQSAADVMALRAALDELPGRSPGLMFKIETRRGFEQLPAILLAAMGAPAIGVMIARGDLAVECGWERLAELQEEILWACEAAHVPVVWATQVLEGLAKTGRPSRAEVTDAAMGARAECVMLNKGAHIVDAVRMLDDILRRMQSHQSKKRPLLRALRSWHRSSHRPPTNPA
jgi:pyruvate kinase